MAKGKRATKCDKWRQGMCAAHLALYCPRERAEYLGPGECCHHPLRVVRDQLTEMKRAGVNIAKYGKRLRSGAFVAKLYRRFKKSSSSFSS